MKYSIDFGKAGDTIHLQGDIDERVGTALLEIRSQLRSRRCTFDMASVGRINSIGISVWIAHFKSFEKIAVTYMQVPYTFISLCRVMPVLRDGGEFQSFYARYYCDHCALRDEVQFALVGRDEALASGALPTRPCEKCGASMQADPNDADYVSFFSPAGGRDALP